MGWRVFCAFGVVVSARPRGCYWQDSDDLNTHFCFYCSPRAVVELAIVVVAVVVRVVETEAVSKP